MPVGVDAFFVTGLSGAAAARLRDFRVDELQGERTRDRGRPPRTATAARR